MYVWCIIIDFVQYNVFVCFPSAYGSLTVRSLLDTSSQCLAEFDFPDPYSQVRTADVRFTFYCITNQCWTEFNFPGH